MKVDNFERFIELREQYPEFTFDDFSLNIDSQSINITFYFNISNTYFFQPEISIPNISLFNAKNLTVDILELYAFHLGMIELISYWKATCSPRINVKAGLLSDTQLEFWKKVYFNGLGEFFYHNQIRTKIDDFVSIKTEGKTYTKKGVPVRNAFLVPVGGGKDSIVTLQLLTKNNFEVIPFALNPRKAVYRTIETAGYKKDDIIIFKRELDPQLLVLNDKGFLNGHTPFSALLAFNTILAAACAGIKWIALSNESSANEPTIPGTTINHQYSKSFEFEKDFRQYIKKYITWNIEYFSFLRPLNEIQISKIFSLNPEFLTIFRSCNVGSKEDKWCGKCPKCLFTFIILFPFIDGNELLNVFGKNMLDDYSLKGIFDQLIGNDLLKPFECIGTIDEVNIALIVGIKKIPGNDFPLLLKYYKSTPLYEKYKSIDPEDFYEKIEKNHFLRDWQVKLLVNKLI